MKKMKKIIATLVCLVVAIATLSACTGGTGNSTRRGVITDAQEEEGRQSQKEEWCRAEEDREDSAQGVWEILSLDEETGW